MRPAPRDQPRPPLDASPRAGALSPSHGTGVSAAGVHKAGVGHAALSSSSRGGGSAQGAASMLRSQSSSKLSGMPRNSSVDDFLSLVESGDIPAPEQDMLSTSIFHSLNHSGEKRSAEESDSRSQPSQKLAKAQS
uniref:Uncharacterized protein n=1 Tax=Rhizochromulina marina TaxID=1034831 RepID=A0A7S2RCG7_9STRA|mmetsp:Transcript_14135/g.41604  ORF Transcript_14135/g.41604 Transcript_14135/m.41604 type:complete len:135 (+) Transcript_14135:62-466(+)